MLTHTTCHECIATLFVSYSIAFLIFLFLFQIQFDLEQLFYVSLSCLKLFLADE